MECKNFELFWDEKVKHKKSWEIYEYKDEFLICHTDNWYLCDITKCQIYKLFSELLKTPV